jgi:hypothetical protein
LLKQTRSQAPYLIPLLALIIALPTTLLPDRVKDRVEQLFTLCANRLRQCQFPPTGATSDRSASP